MSNRPRIFIGYATEDKGFVDELMVHLTPLGLRYDVDIWSDKQIQAGDDWEQEIEAALRTANIVLVLVSAHYLASKWSRNVELPVLLERASMGAARIIPINVRPSAWAHTPLAYYQALPKNMKAVSELTEADRDRMWADLIEILEGELYRLTSGDEARDKPSVKRRRKVKASAATLEVSLKDADGDKTRTGSHGEALPPKFFISHAKEDGDFAENLKGRLKETGLDGLIDIDVLDAGDEWRNEIDEAILESRALILVLSPDSKGSEYVTYEWAFALGSGLRIVPLMLRDTSIHPRLEVFQYLDFTNRRARPWRRLFGLLADV